MKHNFKIEEKEVGQRLDKFILNKIDGFSRGEIIRVIKNNQVSINNKKVKPSTSVKLNDKIKINISKKIERLKPNSKIKLDIIFENDDFWIINKPSGLQVHPSAINKNETLVNALINLKPDLENVGENWERPGIVHRLDKDTSGIMLVAKNNESFQELKKMFQEKKVQKTYLTLIWGKLEKESGLIDLPIAKTLSHQKQKIAQGKFSGQAREAQTEYKVVEQFTFPYSYKLKDIKDATNIEKLFAKSGEEKIKISLVKVKPKTGRTHQIRVHLAHLGHPLINDKRYYKKIHKTLKENFVNKNHQTFLLHSEKIEFSLQNKKYTFSAPLPDYFEQILDNLRQNS
ncbi:MAG: RluA family pseudouridine synthase [Candidatus Moranbacteria bacterium]|nr:RluA family pseudouridine synthase [Candidatus Moranbacteria bacterium]